MAIVKDIFVNIDGERKRISKVLRGNGDNIDYEQLYQYHKNDVVVNYKRDNHIELIINGLKIEKQTKIRIDNEDIDFYIEKISYTDNTYYAVGVYSDVYNYADEKYCIAYSKNLSEWNMLVKFSDVISFPIVASYWKKYRGFFVCSKNNILVIGINIGLDNYGYEKTVTLAFKNHELINIETNNYYSDLTGLCYGSGFFVRTCHYLEKKSSNMYYTHGIIQYSKDGINWLTVPSMNNISKSILPWGLCYRKNKFYVFTNDSVYIIENKNDSLILTENYSYGETIMMGDNSINCSINDKYIICSGEDFEKTDYNIKTGCTIYSDDGGKTWNKLKLYKDIGEDKKIDEKYIDITFNENENIFYFSSYNYYYMNNVYSLYMYIGMINGNDILSINDEFIDLEKHTSVNSGTSSYTPPNITYSMMNH